MSILQVDPHNKTQCNKDNLWEEAKDLCNQFLILNHIEMTTMEIDNNYKYNGYYNYETIEAFVNLKRSKVPVKNPGYCWSFPGYKSDLTCVGILTHEIGHHIHYMKMVNDPNIKKKEKVWKDIMKREKPITQYDKGNTIEESIAEALKVFITNPDLLKEGRPLRYNFLTQEFNLKPLHNQPWKEVLKYADTKFISAAQSWIKSKNIRIKKSK